MSRLFPLLILILSSGEAFELLAENYLGDLTTISPASATLIGDHSTDDRRRRFGILCYRNYGVAGCRIVFATRRQ